MKLYLKLEPVVTESELDTEDAEIKPYHLLEVTGTADAAVAARAVADYADTGDIPLHRRDDFALRVLDLEGNEVALSERIPANTVHVFHLAAYEYPPFKEL